MGQAVILLREQGNAAWDQKQRINFFFFQSQNGIVNDYNLGSGHDFGPSTY